MTLTANMKTFLACCCRRSRRDCGTPSQFRSLALPVHSEGGSHHRHPDDHHDHKPDYHAHASFAHPEGGNLALSLHLHNQVDTMSFGSSAQKGCYCALSTAASHGQRWVVFCVIFQKQKFVFLWKIISGRRSTSWWRIRPHSPVRIVEERWFFRSLSLLQLESVEAWEFWSLRFLKLDYFEAWLIFWSLVILRLDHFLIFSFFRCWVWKKSWLRECPFR